MSAKMKAHSKMRVPGVYVFSIHVFLFLKGILRSPGMGVLVWGIACFRAPRGSPEDVEKCWSSPRVLGLVKMNSII